MDRTSAWDRFGSWMSRHRVLVLVTLVALMAVQISSNWKPDADGVNYLLIAKNLALHGRLQRQGMTHLYYAPGYSILISPAYLLAQRPFAVVGVIHLLSAAVLMLAMYRWFVRYDTSGAILITAMVMVNVGLWDLYRQVRVEVPFMALLMVSAVLLQGVIEARGTSRFVVRLMAAAIVVMAMCCIRQVGFLLAGGFFVALAMYAKSRVVSWRRAMIAAAVIGVAALAVLIGLIQYDAFTAKQSGPDEVTYLQNGRAPNQSLAAQIIEGVRRQTAEVGRLILPGMWKSYSKPGQWLSFNTGLYLMLFGFMAWGWWKLFGSTWDPLVAMFPFYFVFFVIWPFDQGTRFTVPMLPVLAASLWFLLRPLGERRRVIFSILIVVHLLVSVGIWLRDAKIVRQWNTEWAAMQQVADQVPPGREMIVARDLPTEQWLFLAYLMDRRFTWQAKDEKIKPHATWVISPEKFPDVTGFDVIANVQGLKIERRRSSE